MMLGSRIVRFSVLGFGSFRFGPRGSGTHEVYGFYWSMRVQGLDGHAAGREFSTCISWRFPKQAQTPSPT